MTEFDITSYFDLAAGSQEEMQVGEDAIMADMSEANLAAASQEEMQACADIIMADMSEADAMAVSLQSQDSSSMDVEMKTDNIPVYR